MSPADIFPSIYMQAEKIIDLLIWWLNPVEKPPQKILSLSHKGINQDIFIGLLKKAGYEGHKNVLENFELIKTLANQNFNLVFLFEWRIPKDLINLKMKILKMFKIIHDNILKSSSYLILEIQFDSEKNIDVLEELLYDAGFGSTTVLIPEVKPQGTNPFSSVNFAINNYCWLTALSRQTDEDPTEWLNEYFE